MRKLFLAAFVLAMMALPHYAKADSFSVRVGIGAGYYPGYAVYPGYTVTHVYRDYDDCRPRYYHHRDDGHHYRDRDWRHHRRDHDRHYRRDHDRHHRRGHRHHD